ncbi:MAG: L-serine ammonia-lyase, iron-sulfur-dependent, subunit alpha [Anaerosacchariphilus sp.]
MDFKNAKELLALCEERKLCISDVMRRREIEEGEITGEIRDARMKKAYEIMRESARGPIKKPGRSMGGLLGGEAKMLSDWQQGDGQGKSLCGPVLGRAVAYAMAVLETNASMGLIVAAPTAGSSGIVPGVLLALEEQFHFTEAEMIQALYNAGAVGYLAMRNATVAGAVGGCQAEVGVASAMAASAAVELMGSSPKACLDAASTVLMNLLGLVCDPVGGLVEYPCQNRNAAGVAVALTSAEMALAGVPQLIPLDEMIAVMYNVGRRIPAELRETALGGCAAAPSACEACGKC